MLNLRAKLLEAEQQKKIQKTSYNLFISHLAGNPHWLSNDKNKGE